MPDSTSGTPVIAVGVVGVVGAVSVDGSPNSDEALRWVTDYARGAAF